MAVVVRYVCDACKKEVKEKRDLYNVSIMDTVQYQLSSEVNHIGRDLCVDCYHEFSSKTLDIFFGTRKWLENN